MAKKTKEYYEFKLKELCAAEAHGMKITGPDIAAEAVFHMRILEQEHFVVITVNGAHKIINTHTITKGILNKTMIHPREVFRVAITDNASAIILIHNHPSGQLEPSEEDRAITRRLKDAGELIGIPVLDHMIIAGSGYYSFVEGGLL